MPGDVIFPAGQEEKKSCPRDVKSIKLQRAVANPSMQSEQHIKTQLPRDLQLCGARNEGAELSSGFCPKRSNRVSLIDVYTGIFRLGDFDEKARE